MALHGKKRLGLLVPPQNTTMEDDFHRWLPDSVRLHSARMYTPPGSSNGGAARHQIWGDHVEENARGLGQAPVDVIAFGCTGASFFRGLGYAQELIKRIEVASGGVKAVVTSWAAIEALHELGVKKIAACSPYPEESNERLRKFLTDAGFEVVSFDNVDGRQMGGGNINAMEPEVAYNLGKSVDRPEAEAIFISCTAFRAAEIIDELEEATGKPVVTSNQATFWACMRVLGEEPATPGPGKLLRERIAV